MKHLVKWLVAGLVTAAVCATTLWLVGALLLPHIIRDPGIRWSLAGVLAAAVSALPAMWGQSFATRDSSNKILQHPSSSNGPAEDLPGHVNMISGGTFHGPVIQGQEVLTQIIPSPPPSAAKPETIVKD
jgi:hypothetical protein